MQTVVGAFEAKTHFAQLVERATQGQETLITRRGKLVAKIVPIESSFDVKAAQRAALQLRRLAQEMNLSSADWKEDRENGRA